MSTVKKAFQPIITLLAAAATAGKTVADVIDEVTAMCVGKERGGQVAQNHLRDTDGNVVAVFDYYFKRWMPLVGDEAVEYGVKAGTATGLNTMCKEGVSNWGKQQREAKQAKDSLLDKLSSEEITVADLPQMQIDIEAARTSIVPTALGFETEVEVVEYLTDNGIVFGDGPADAAA